MSTFPIVTDQRFFPIRLSELFDVNSYLVQKYVAGKLTSAIPDSIIMDISYPIYFGQPDDSHTFNCFHGNQKWCTTITDDFWQTASETLAIRIGDCEDSSIAMVTCLRASGVPADEVYECFGVVTHSGTILGGHGWACYKFNDSWHVIESTLDAPPQSYPVVESPFTDHPVGSLVYEGHEVFNDQQYHKLRAWEEGDNTMRKKEKVLEKYKAIAEAWNVDTKPVKLAKKSKIAKLLKRV